MFLNDTFQVICAKWHYLHFLNVSIRVLRVAIYGHLSHAKIANHVNMKKISCKYTIAIQVAGSKKVIAKVP